MSTEVWYAIPSANPGNCRRVLPKWRERGYKIAVLQNADARADVPADIVIEVDAYAGWSAAVNELCARAVPKDAPIVVTGGDDMHPDPNHTASELAEQFLGRFPDTFGVMQPHGDDYMNARLYCGSPWLGRRFIESANGGAGPMWPEYWHCWGDCELYWVARGYDALWLRDDLSQYHEHFTRTGADEPEYWRRSSGDHALADNRTFIFRALRGFPGHGLRGDERPFETGPELEDTIRIAEDWFTQTLDRWRPDPRDVRCAAALDHCRTHGLTPVALYGGGQHTRAVGPSLCAPDVEVACIIDDAASAQGTTMWRYPVVAPSEALTIGLRAVILSTDTVGAALWRRARPFLEAGVEVIRLDEIAPAEKQDEMRLALEACAERDWRRVAIVGAGADTDDCLDGLGNAPIEIVGVLSTTTARRRDLPWPVVPLESWSDLAPDAVILSTSRFERDLWERTAPIRAAGVPVLRLWGPSEHRHSTALAAGGMSS